MRIGVGSRCRIVTGGAKGPDQWAEAAARARGLTVAVHRPDLQGVRVYYQAAQRHYDRNPPR